MFQSKNIGEGKEVAPMSAKIVVALVAAAFGIITAIVE